MDARFALLLSCFFLSGFAALLYQTAWTRELSFVFGTSELAVAAVLAAYMGGLALGAAAAARFAMRLRRPVLAYGVLELAIALSALSVPSGIRLINAVYVGLLGGGSELLEGGATAATVFQLAAAFAVLLPPTAFMGATLPLLARHAVRKEAEIGSRVGVLYAVNTAGAIAGTVCAAFWLMPELGLRHTVWVGAALNGLVFALAALLARGAAKPPVAESGRAAAPPGAWILPAIALSGAVSFAYEVLWTRLLGHLLGASLNAFASMLASFLLGIALGSAFAARLATSRERAAIGFGVAQLGIALTSYGAFALADRLPELSLWLGAGPGAPLASAAVAVAALLPITLCIGATFPFAVRLLARSPEQTAGATARAYAWNTVGAIVGALGAGFVLLPQLGFAGTVSVGVAANLGLAAVAALSVRPRRTRLAVAAVVAGAALLALPAPTPWSLLRFSSLTQSSNPGEIAYFAVGRSSTVLLFDEGATFRLTTNGLPEAVIERVGMLPQPTVVHWLGLLPPLLRPEARELLVVGLGGGSVLESVPSSVGSIDVIELEPEVLNANQRMAAERAIDPLADARVRVHIGDARGVLQLTQNRYDAIISQPSHPWTAGASHLYTREFFAMARSRLKPDGVFVQWIGLKFVDEALLRSLMATLVSVFPHVEIYQPGAAAGLLFAASEEPLAILENAGRALRVAPEDFAPFGVHRVEDLAAVRVLDDEGTRVLAEGAALNTDDHNLLASRSSRLGDAVLDSDSFRMLWKDRDPLLTEMDGLDRFALIRKLTAINAAERATALTFSEDKAVEETGLGWVEVGLARPNRAVRHFARALKLAPASSDVLAGLVAVRPFAFEDGKSWLGVSERDLDERLVALIAARRHAAAGELDAIAALDAELGGIRPGEALFEEASRLRIHWRLAAEDAEAAAEAQSIAETLLSRNWTPQDALLRARAAVAADRPTAAWGALSRIAKSLPKRQRTGPLVEAALEVASELPEEIARDLRSQLRPGRPSAVRP
ncbi:MAG: fused MFS/spermidine synthase [Deltaproteobacteria bacterium]|nr:fused MFS/spermidine synthase [Deltaproteobacteria bacterium]MBW2692640.1 fused MFS/spermidine synthase [Deltaproteobacteria bacterium]